MNAAVPPSTADRLHSMIPDCPPSPLSSPHSDSSYLSSPDSLKSTMIASDHGVKFEGALSDHKEYYLDDGNIMFLVENTIFKVHRFFFQRDSQFFRDTFSRFPNGPCTNGDLLTLPDITSLDFERFLGVLYPKDFSKPTATSVDEWISILDLSMRWGFESIRLLAIEKLNLLASPIDKIVLGRKYTVAKWLCDAYRAICEREHALTLEEGLRLGMAEVINISHARQAIRQGMTLIPPSHLNSVIKKTFGLATPALPHPSEEAPGTDSKFDFNGNEVESYETDVDEEFGPPKQWYCGTPEQELEAFAYESIAGEVEPELGPSPTFAFGPTFQFPTRISCPM